jgi:hypothetical protein
VPPDGRVPLSFERNELRQRCVDESLDKYLEEAGMFFEALRTNGGSFFVKDFDHLARPVVYEPKMKLLPKSNECPLFWRAVLPSRLAEEGGFSVRPIVYSLKRRTGSDTELDSPNPSSLGFVMEEVVTRTGRIPVRRWHRLICFTGLGSAVEPLDAHRPFFKLENVFQLDKENTCTPKHLELAIPDMIKMHLSCHGPIAVGNPFSREWNPFHITWHRIIPRPSPGPGACRPGVASWKSGGLYDAENEKLIQEQAFTLGFFPSGVVRDWPTPNVASKFMARDSDNE